MEPTLHCAAAPHCRRFEDDRVVVTRLIYRFTAVHRGDIVAFTLPDGARSACQGEGVRIKRIVGLPGETLSQVDGRIYIDKKRLDEDRFSATPADFGPVRVPPDRYFVLGDNRRASCDSRHFGAIPKANLRGKVVLVYSSPWRFRRP
jgi:signal peptidase I